MARVTLAQHMEHVPCHGSLSPGTLKVCHGMGQFHLVALGQMCRGLNFTYLLALRHMRHGLTHEEPHHSHKAPQPPDSVNHTRGTMLACHGAWPEAMPHTTL
jgi:hypothetical protein